MNNSDRLIWLNGVLLPVADAKVNVLSPTCQFGANVFEGIRCYWNSSNNQLYAFRLKDHFARLQKSVKLFRFEEKYSFEDLKNSFIETIKANNYTEDIAVLQTIFLDGMGSWFATTPTGMFIAPIPKNRLDPSNSSGIKCCISTYERINDNSISPRVKVGANYINSRSAQLEAFQNNYDSAILLNNNGKVSEGTGSCLFIVRNGTILTPPHSASILESITRDTIISVAREELGLLVVERDIDRTELYIADEAFLCGSAIELTSIVNIDGYVIGKGVKGEITRKLHELYLKIVSGNVVKYSYWLTPIY